MVSRATTLARSVVGSVTGSAAGSGWLARAVGLVATAVLLTTLVRYATADHTDLAAYRAAARALATGQPLYADALIWREVGYTIADPRPVPTDGPPYVYPPLLAFVMLPIVALGELTRLTWYAIIFVAGIGTAFALAPLLLGRPGPRVLAAPAGALALAALVLLYQPTRRVLYFAQVDTVTLFCLALGLVAFAARRDVRAGLVVALAIAIKPFLGLVLLYFVWKRAYRAAVVGAAASGILVLGPLLALGPDTVRDYLAVGAYWSGPTFAATILNQSPYGVALRTFTTTAMGPPLVEAPGLVGIVRLAFALAALAAFVLAVPRTRERAPGVLAIEYGLALAAMLLISPLSEDIHFVYALPALLASGAWAWRDRRPGPAVVVPGLAATALYGLFLMPLHGSLQHNVPFVGLCLVAALATATAVMQRHREETDAPTSSSAAPSHEERQAA